MENHIVCFGQSSAQVVTEMDKLISKMNLIKTKTPISFSNTDNIFQNSFTDDRLSVCDVFRAAFEENGLTPGMNIISDLSSHKIGSLISDVTSHFPTLSINAANIVSEKLYGARSLLTVFNLNSVLETCDSLLVREYTDAKIFLEAESSVGYNLNDVHSVIGADLITAFSSNQGQPVDDFFVWPSCLATSQKIIDVRSSLWKASKRDKAKVEYNSLRSMSANLHSLHMASHRGNGASYLETGFCISSANLVDVVMNKKSKLFEYFPTSSIEADVNVALSWATPGIHWPTLGKLTLRNELTSSLARSSKSSIASSFSVESRISGSSTASTMIAGSQTPRMSTSRTVASAAGGSSSSAAPLPTARIPQPQRPLTDSTVTSTPATAASGPKVSAVSFQSPYALHFIDDACCRAEELLRSGAFLHRFEAA